MKILKSFIYEGKRVLNTNEDKSFSVNSKKLEINKIKEIMHLEHKVDLENDIFVKSRIMTEEEFSISSLQKKTPSGYKYVEETYDEHLRKKFVEKEAECDFVFLKNIFGFNFYICKKEKKIMAIFEAKKSFREIEDVKLVEKVNNEAFILFKDMFNVHEVKEIVSFFTYSGIKTNFYFVTQIVHNLFFTELVIYADDFIKNLKIDGMYYKQMVYYVEPQYIK